MAMPTLQTRNESNEFSTGCRAVGRGVQYVHWVMHKCIMVKVGGIHVKYVKSR